MKIFLIKVILVSVFTFLLILLLQIVLFLRTNKKLRTGHDNLDITTDVNSELVLMGSSRCRSHFDPVFFENEFNLKSINIGVDGHSELSMIYVRLMDYLKNNSPPKYAILSIDPFTSAGDISKKSANTVNKDAFARYAYAPLNDDWETINYLGFNTWEKYVPLYAIFKYKQLSNSLYQNNSEQYLKYGYDRHDNYWNILKNPVNNEMQNNYQISRQSSKVKKALSQLNDLCSAKGIKLICIQTPVYKSIFDRNSFNIAKTICADLDITYIDANYNSIRIEIKNFYNSNHLNLNGVTEMNNKLKGEQKLIKVLR